MQNTTKKTLDSDKNGVTFLFQRPSSWSLQLPDVYRLLLKEEGMLNGGEHGPVPTFFKCVAAIKLQMSLRSSQNSGMCLFHIWYVFYVHLWIKRCFLRFAFHCILVLFPFYPTLLELGLYFCSGFSHHCNGRGNGNLYWIIRQTDWIGMTQEV